MMFRSAIVCCPWDLTDLGLEKSLDRVQALGATSVTVPATCPPACQLRAHPGIQPRIFRTRGGFFFHPDESRYENTRIRPITSSWLKGRDPLSEVAAGCRKRKLELRLRFSAFEVGRIGPRYADCRAKTVFGDMAADTLCPANADVRALLLSAVADATQRYAPAAVEITDIRHHSGTVSATRLKAGIDLGPTGTSLLALCFCESSRQWAWERGVDTAAAASSAHRHLDSILANGHHRAKDWPTLLKADEILNSYVGCQTAALDTLVDRLVAETPIPVVLVLPPERTGRIVPTEPALRGAGGVIAPAPLPIEGILAEMLTRPAPDSVFTELEFEAADVAANTPDQLVSTVKRATEAGIRGVGFSNLGIMSEPSFTAIKQAVRYATRSAG
jgi:hypothetical protein